MIRKWKNTLLILSLLFAWIYFVMEFSSVFLFNENKYVFFPIFIDSKDVRHTINCPRGRISRIHTDKREATKSYTLESSEFQLEVLLQGITHFSTLGAVQKATSFVRLWQWLGFLDKSKTCRGQGGVGWGGVG